MVVEKRQVIETRGRVGMFRTEDRFSDLESLLKERFGLGVIAPMVIDRRQITETFGISGFLSFRFASLPKTKDSSSNRCKRYRRQNPNESAQGFCRCRLLLTSLLCCCAAC